MCEPESDTSRAPSAGGTDAAIGTTARRPRRPGLLWRIVGPTALVLAVVGFVVPVCQAWLAVRDQTARQRAQLATAMSALEGIRFPLNADVLGRLKALTGAEFVATQADTVLSTTVDRRDLSIGTLRAAIRSSQGHTTAPRVTIGGQEYMVSAANIPPNSTLYALYPVQSFSIERLRPALLPLGVGLLVCVIGTLWLASTARLLTADLARLRNAVEQLPDLPPEDIRAQPPSDEFDALHHVITQAAERLKQMAGQIADSERQRVTAQIAAGFAHHLRNALTGVRLSLGLHLARCPNRGDLEHIMGELELAEHQLRGLLFLSSLDALELSPHDPVPAVRTALKLIRNRADHQRIQLTDRLPDQMAPALLHPEAWTTCVVSLLLNALDAVSPGTGTIEVQGRSSGDELMIEFVDNGPGLPPGLTLDDVTKPYLSTKPAALGLGLTIVHELVTYMQGVLSYRRDQGKSYFTVTLRAATAAPTAAGASLAEQQNGPQLRAH